MIVETTAADERQFLDYARSKPFHPLTANNIEMSRDTGLFGPVERFAVDLRDMEGRGLIGIDREQLRWFALLSTQPREP